MKDLWKSGVLILLIIGVLYIIFLRECKSPPACPPKGQVLVAQSTWDSIKALANKPPIIKRDTIRIKGDIVYVPSSPLPQPKPEPKDSTINTYSDSLIRNNINVWYSFKVKGVLLERTWVYLPVTTLVNESITHFIPYIIDRPIRVPVNGLFVYGMVGGNMNSFLPGAGADFITKKGTEFGYLYQRYGTENFHNFKLGIKIQLKKK